MQRVLTIVGSSARAAAVSAARSGFFVYAADLFADTDLRKIAQTTQVGNYPAGLKQVLAGQQPGSWLYTGALENHPELVDAWARLRPLWGNRGDVLRAVRNPPLVAEVLRREGLRTPGVTNTPQQVPADGTWLRKPVKSAGGQKITPWSGIETASSQENVTDSGSSEDWYFQERITGRSCSATFLSANRNAVLLGATEQLLGSEWSGDTDLRYCGSIGPVHLTDRDRRELLRIGGLLAHEFELVGLWGIDLVVNSEGVWLIEVNPRLTASVEVLEHAMNLNAVELHAAACEHSRLPASISTTPTGRFAGKAIVFAPARVRFPLRGTGEGDVELAAQTLRGLADIPAPGTFIDQGWPIATVLAGGATMDEVRVKLWRRSRCLLEQCELKEK